jgi:hypothetical protein
MVNIDTNLIGSMEAQNERILLEGLEVSIVLAKI